MKTVKMFYDKYNYPKVGQHTHRQMKNHAKLVQEILFYGGIALKDVAGKKVLDAGCGTGDKCVFLAKHGANVTAIDFSDGQLNDARKLAITNKVNVKFFNKDLVNDSLKDLGTFDVILCTGVLHHTENPKKAFASIVGQLKPNGTIVIGLYHKYARLRYFLIRLLIKCFVSWKYDSEKIINWLNNNWVGKKLSKAPSNAIYDRYVVPYESYHTLKDIKEWFSENDIQLTAFSENASGFELFSIFKKKTIFFVGGRRR